jgi:TatD DNase family protein
MNEYKIIDAHSHIWSKEFDADRTTIIQDGIHNNVHGIVEVGCDLQSSMKALELSKQYSFISSVAGLHPHDANKFEIEKKKLFQLAASNSFVAIGEIGLDYYRMHSDKESQRIAFIEQLDLAVELQLPVVIHSREAEEETLKILKQWKQRAGKYLGLKSPVGMMHCFSGNFALASEYANLGFMISIPGTITYPKNIVLRELVSKIPASKLLIETDTPYLTPVPHRGKRNETSFINYTLEEIANIKKTAKSEIAKVIYDNTISFFKLVI